MPTPQELKGNEYNKSTGLDEGTTQQYTMPSGLQPGKMDQVLLIFNGVPMSKLEPAYRIITTSASWEEFLTEVKHYKHTRVHLRIIYELWKFRNLPTELDKWQACKKWYQEHPEATMTEVEEPWPPLSDTTDEKKSQ